MDERIARFNDELSTLCKTYNVKITAWDSEWDIPGDIDIVDATTNAELHTATELPEKPCTVHNYLRHNELVYSYCHKVEFVCTFCRHKKVEVHDQNWQIVAYGHIKEWYCTNKPSCGLTRRELT